jgi:ribonuclease P protein component
MRVTQRCDFEAALTGGLRLCDERLTIWVRLNDLAVPRLGLIVGRRHGNAVQRNRLKRLIREAFRLNQKRIMSGMDLICSPAPGKTLTLDGVVESLLKLSKRARSRLSKVGFDIRHPRQNNH